MSLTSNCKTDTNVKFTGQIGNDKVLFRVDRLRLSEHLNLTAKLELARAMLQSFTNYLRLTLVFT